VAPALLFWLVGAWTFLPGSPLWWTLFTILTVSFPVYAHVTTSLLHHPRGVPWTSYFWHVWGDFGTNTKQVALMLAFLPHQAWMMVDAIVRVAYRKLISGKYLLEWVTAAQAESGSRHDLAIDVPCDVVCDRLRHFPHPASTKRTVACIAISNRMGGVAAARVLDQSPRSFVQSVES
jgi:hypothetical protein